MKHDICYSIGKNKNDCDREMINDLDNLKYRETSKSTPIIRGIINTKQKFGLGNNPNEILSQELHTQRKINSARRKVISNQIDHIWGIFQTVNIIIVKNLQKMIIVKTINLNVKKIIVTLEY